MNFQEVLETVKINERRKSYDVMNPKSAERRRRQRELDATPPTDITRNVRISSNPDDYDVDRLLKKLMRNKITHHTYDAEFESLQTQKNIKDLVF